MKVVAPVEEPSNKRSLFVKVCAAVKVSIVSETPHLYCIAGRKPQYCRHCYLCYTRELCSRSEPRTGGKVAEDRIRGIA